MEKVKPVRICDISRVLRISSTSLISFLQEKGYSIIGDFRSPLSSRMMELIQNGYQEGPPFGELTPLLPRVEKWESQNHETVERLHTPPKPELKIVVEEEGKPKKRRRRKIKFAWRAIPDDTTYTGRISLTFLDLELIQRIFELEEAEKIIVRDLLRRKTILQAISHLE